MIIDQFSIESRLRKFFIITKSEFNIIRFSVTGSEFHIGSKNKKMGFKKVCTNDRDMSI